MKVIDGTGLIVGRVATYAAKKALEGEKVVLVNCDKMIFTGQKDAVFNKFKEKRERGSPHWGPYYPRMSDRIVRRTVRGMLPYKKERGMMAYRRIKCHIGVPAHFKDKKIETIESANAKKFTSMEFTNVKDLCQRLGGLIK